LRAVGDFGESLPWTAMRTASVLVTSVAGPSGSAAKPGRLNDAAMISPKAMGLMVRSFAIPGVEVPLNIPFP
jgi:hypothetical protein